MKKFFIAISVLAALTLCMVPAQANMGIPDDVPGHDAVVPFLVALGGGINTLVVFTDVRGYTNAATAPPTGWNYHYTVNTIKSVTVYDDNLPGTKFDIESIDAYTIIQKMAPAIRSQLEIDLDGDGTNDHWAGYIYFALNVPTTAGVADRNQMIGQTLLLNLQVGQAAGANTWMKEINTSAAVAAFVNVNSMEIWSANALARAEQLQSTNATTLPAVAFGLYPRFYINDANAATCVMIWKDQNWISVAAGDDEATPYLHINFYNAAEKKASSNLPLPYEMNIVCIEPYIPASLHSAYPKEGWIAIEVPDISGRGFANINTDWAGYTWIYATGAASESWSYLTQIHRDVAIGDPVDWDAWN